MPDIIRDKETGELLYYWQQGDYYVNKATQDRYLQQERDTELNRNAKYEAERQAKQVEQDRLKWEREAKSDFELLHYFALYGRKLTPEQCKPHYHAFIQRWTDKGAPLDMLQVMVDRAVKNDPADYQRRIQAVRREQEAKAEKQRKRDAEIRHVAEIKAAAQGAVAYKIIQGLIQSGVFNGR